MPTCTRCHGSGKCRGAVRTFACPRCSGSGKTATFAALIKGWLTVIHAAPAA